MYEVVRAVVIGREDPQPLALVLKHLARNSVRQQTAGRENNASSTMETQRKAEKEELLRAHSPACRGLGRGQRELFGLNAMPVDNPR